MPSQQILFQSEHHPLVAEQFETLEQYCLSLLHLKAYETAAAMARGKRVLDLGCNNGYGSELLAREAAHVTGVDVSERSIAAARRRCPRLEFLLVDGVTLPFPDASFDAVFSFQVIEHIDDPAPYLAEIRRVLRPDGVAVLTTPNGEVRLEPGMAPWNEFHVREYSTRELSALLGRTFGSVEILGLTAIAELARVEERRVRRARLMARTTRRGGLAGRVLGPLRAVRRGLLAALSRSALVRHRREQAFRRFGTADLHYEKDNGSAALDLMAICRP